MRNCQPVRVLLCKRGSLFSGWLELRCSRYPSQQQGIFVWVQTIDKTSQTIGEWVFWLVALTGVSKIRESTALREVMKLFVHTRTLGRTHPVA